ncbi:MAG: hypothetical protein A2W33_02065 [Chloroflexi bacterium RBG_16_52_11]|nr:MAG: hypothetical protein A2W33_02065 [Chloroflexi bacterium RBG_16_52_11]
MTGEEAHRESRHRVEVLLATYNGGRYLNDQLDSILAQSYPAWRLTVRDDCSTDNTVQIIKDYIGKFPGKIRFIDEGSKRLGALGNFSRLLDASEAEYVMFSDQDDRWLPDKIGLTLRAMLECEARFTGAPILVHTDLYVTDRDLNVISKSFWNYNRLDPVEKGLNSLLTFNNVTGCTVMINSALRRLATPMPQEALVHDMWLALVASAFGHIEHVKVPTVLYRQHGENVIGTTRYPFGYFASKLANLEKTAATLRMIVAQAGAFHSAYGTRLKKADREVVHVFSTLLEKHRAARFYSVFKYRFTGSGFLRNLGIMLLWLCMGNKSIEGAKTRAAG